MEFVQSDEMKDIGILGGGMSGISLGNFLSKPFEILEKNNHCGGLFERFEKDRFTFDMFGCHIFFSKNEETRTFIKSLLGKDALLVKRKNKIYLKGRFVKYPIENGLHDLEKEDILGCLTDYINSYIARETGKNVEPENFKEWLVYRFGKYLAELYLIPYNEKIWKTDTKEIGLDWISGTVPQPSLEDVIKSAIGIETEGGIIEQLNAIYPKHGGFRTIIEKLEKNIDKKNIVTNFAVSGLHKKDGLWYVSNGTEERCYKQIVSTIPIPELISFMDRVPQEVEQAAAQLKFNSLISVMIAVNAPYDSDLTAVYFPEKNIFFNRVGIMKNYSPYNVPEGKSAFIAEITTNPSDTTWFQTNEKIKEKVLENFEKIGFLRKDDVLFTHVGRTKYAYIIYDINYRKNMDVVNKYLKDVGIITLGRLGQFEYLLSNVCIERAMKIAGQLNNS